MRAVAIAAGREMPYAVVFLLLVTVASVSAKEVILGKLKNIIIIIFRIIQDEANFIYLRNSNVILVTKMVE